MCDEETLSVSRTERALPPLGMDAGATVVLIGLRIVPVESLPHSRVIASFRSASGALVTGLARLRRGRHE